MRFETPFFDALQGRIRELGGLLNAHLHLDRAGTLELSPGAERAASYLSLSAKHGLIPAIHNSHFYDPDNLRERTAGYLDHMQAVGTTRADTVVDVTLDRIGTSAFDIFRSLAAERADTFKLCVGAYSPLGFTDAEPERWALLESAATDADFIGSLPERDDRVIYPDHIGYREHCRRILELARRLDKPLHIHVDQRNDPRENGTEQVLDIIREVGIVPEPDAEPWVWLVHVISPSTYDESRFQHLADRLRDLNVGVICCPSAALSMRQLRPILTPTGNCIARILELLAAGIHVRLGSDNLCDVTSPAGTPDLLAEVFVLCNAVRFYDVDVLAHLAAGHRIDEASRRRVRDHLGLDAREVGQAIKQYDG